MRLLCLGVFIQLESKMEILEKAALEGRAMYKSHFPSTSLTIPSLLSSSRQRHTQPLIWSLFQHPLDCLSLVIRESQGRTICTPCFFTFPLRWNNNDDKSQKGIGMTWTSSRDCFCNRCVSSSLVTPIPNVGWHLKGTDGCYTWSTSTYLLLSTYL